jgi:putative hemolysin
MAVFFFILTLLLSAFFSGSEMAFITANRLKIRAKAHIEEEEKFGSHLLVNTERLLTSILVGNNVVMVACSSIAVFVFRPYIADSLLILVTTAFLLIFGEILPKSFAQQIPNILIKFIPPLLNIFYFLFYPLIAFAEKLSQFFVRLMGENKKAVSEFFRKQDLPLLIRKYSSPDHIGIYERLLISKAVKIGEKRVVDIMIPRTEMYGVDKSVDVDRLKQVFTETGFSRLPVYDGTPDNIQGFTYLFDLLTFKNHHRVKIRKAIFLPESMSALNALKKLRKNEKSIAVIIDEHGGTSGLVTLEDIIEELFGGIFDEFDDDTQLVKSTDDRTIIASGRAEIDDIEEEYRLKLPRGDYVTIGGLVEDRLGYIPRPNEVIAFPNFKITVLEADERKVIKVKIQK